MEEINLHQLQPEVMELEKINTMYSGTNAELIGLCVSVSLWLVTSWRLLRHLLCRKRIQPASSITLRRSFHLLLWAAMSFEAAGYASMMGLFSSFQEEMDSTSKDRLDYVLFELIGRSVFEFLAFASVTVLWYNTAKEATANLWFVVDDLEQGTGGNSSITTTTNSNNYGGAGSALYPNPPTSPVAAAASAVSRVGGSVLSGLFKVMAVLIPLGSVLLSFFLSASLLNERFCPHETLWELNRQSKLFRAQEIFEAICWGVQAGLVFCCIFTTACRVEMSLSTFRVAMPVWQRMVVRLQALGPMMACTACYVIRCAFLLVRVCAGQFPTMTSNGFNIMWWMTFEWAPTLIVVIVSLYSMRRRDPVPENRIRMDAMNTTGGVVDDQYFLSRAAVTTGERSNSMDENDELSSPLLKRPVPPPMEAFYNFRKISDFVSSSSSDLATVDSYLNDQFKDALMEGGSESSSFNQ